MRWSEQYRHMRQSQGKVGDGESTLRTWVSRGYIVYDELPPPTLHPRPSREFLRALVAVKLGIGMRKVDLRALDVAYSEAFPGRRINVNKKKRKD